MHSLFTIAGRPLQWTSCYFTLFTKIEIELIQFSDPNLLAEIITLINMLAEQRHSIIEEEYTVIVHTHSKGH